MVALLTSAGLAGATWEDDLNLQLRVAKASPPWVRLLGAIPQLARPLRFSCPCIGISGCGHALMEMGVQAEIHDVFDLQPRYETFLKEHLISMGMEPSKIKLNLGKQSGDLLQVPFSRLTSPMDFLVAGPPCPSFSIGGTRGGIDDIRGSVFVRVLQWALWYIKFAGLLGVILENVVGITHKVNGATKPIMDVFLAILRREAPEFHWQVDTLQAREYQLPQARVRVFLRGVRKSLCPTMPQVLPPLGRCDLKKILAKLPNTARTDLTVQQRQNLTYYEKMIKKDHRDGWLEGSDIVAFNVDRSPQRVFAANYTANMFPTITCHTIYLFVASVDDVVDDVPDHMRKHFRQPSLAELFQAQGFPADTIMKLPKGIQKFACGNAYPPQLIAATLLPALRAIRPADLRTRARPSSEDDLLRVKNLPTYIKNAAKATQPARKRRHEAD